MTTIEICRKCHAAGTSCCTVRADNTEKMMIPPVSQAEIRRIIDYLETDESRYFTARKNSYFYVEQMLNLFPGMEASVREAFNENLTHFELKTRDDACMLLGDNGCTLPAEIRPHFCRIYPFWFFDDTPLLFQDSQCLALNCGKTMAEVFLSLGTSPEMLHRIYLQICKDWKLYPSVIPDEIPASV